MALTSARLPSGTLYRSAMVGKSPTCPRSFGAHFDTTHALQCPTGGFTMTRHTEVRDILSDTLRDVCLLLIKVTVEPSLVPVTSEQFQLRSASTDSEARLDIAASGFFGGRFERAFFDVRVFSPFARSNQGTSTPSTAAKSKRSAENMVNEHVSQSMHHLCLWFSPALVVLDLLHQPYWSDLQIGFLQRIIFRTMRRLFGFEPGSRLHSFVQAWCAFEDCGHIKAEESTWTPSQ